MRLRCLLEAGANGAARDSAGLTPWDYAEGRASLRGKDVYWRLNEACFGPDPTATCIGL
ncbi:MAG: hypothetical protein OXH85_10880 [Truepera sp.]|nr:hypothetical protein [Truepera sp.]